MRTFFAILHLAATTPAFPPSVLPGPTAAAQDSVAQRAAVLAAAGDETGARELWTRILQQDPADAEARRALGHHEYNGVWYETYAELSTAMRAEAKAKLAEGLVRLGEDWVPVEEFPFRRMGWVQDAGGAWVHPDERAQAELAAQRLADGWQQQGTVWVEPGDFDKWRAGQYKVGEDWLEVAEANVRRAEIPEMWSLRSDKGDGRFLVHTTVDRDSAQWVWWWADQTYADLVRIFGIQPEREPELVCLNSIPQYNAFAAGDPSQGLTATEANGFSSLHYAYFAESWFDTKAQPQRYLGKGVCWWNPTDENLKAFGQHAIRHAAGQSFVEAIDPSWMAVSEAVADPGLGFSTNAFWAEKRVPRWLRYGAASFVERYFLDSTSDTPGWAREWALANLQSSGGLPELDDLFAFQLNANNAEASARLLHGSGAVVAFLLDGSNAKVRQAHLAFQVALKSGEDTAEAVAALEAALRKAEKDLSAFVGA